MCCTDMPTTEEYCDKCTALITKVTISPPPPQPPTPLQIRNLIHFHNFNVPTRGAHKTGLAPLLYQYGCDVIIWRRLPREWCLLARTCDQSRHMVGFDLISQTERLKKNS